MIVTSEMSKRYLEFDVLALQKAAASVAGAATCTSMEKFAEGKLNCRQGLNMLPNFSRFF